jgi:hypothetical protein
VIFKQTERRIHGTDLKIIDFCCATFRISASRQGICLKGELDLCRTDELESLAEAIARAWQWQKKLKDDYVQME